MNELLCTELYYVADVKDHETIVSYVKTFPLITNPSVYGMSENADIMKDQQETTTLFTSTLLTQVCFVVSLIQLSSTFLACTRYGYQSQTSTCITLHQVFYLLFFYHNPTINLSASIHLHQRGSS